MGFTSEAPPREPHQDSFVPEHNNNVNATSVAIPQHQVYIHGYVMSSQPPQGPPRVYDLAEVEGRVQTTQYSNVVYPPPPPQYGATQYGAINNCSAPCSRPQSAARALVSIGYGLAWVFFLPHMLSVAASLHLHKKGALGAHKTAVLVCSYLEIAAFSLCAVASWSFVGTADNWNTETQESYEYDQDYDVFWFGFVYIALWGLVMLAVGIPRLVFSVSKAKEVASVAISDASAARFRKSALATYIVGVVIPPIQIASIACSLHLLNRGQIVKYKGRLMALAALEIFGWIIGASLSWFVVQNCYTTYSYYSGSTWYYYQYCYDTYLGYIFLCVQFGIAVACGIPRVVFTYKGKREGNYALIQ